MAATSQQQRPLRHSPQSRSMSTPPAAHTNRCLNTKPRPTQGSPLLLNTGKTRTTRHSPRSRASVLQHSSPAAGAFTRAARHPAAHRRVLSTDLQRSCQQRGPQGTFSPQEHHLDCNPLPTEQQERSTFPTSWTLQQPARGRGRSIHSGILPVPTVRMSVNCNLSSDSSTLASQKSNTNP